MHLLNALLLAITATSAPAVALSLPSPSQLRSRSQISTRQMQDFIGKGRILLVNSTGYIFDVPNAREKLVGCINALGQAIPISDQCATFEVKGTYPTKIVSPEGNNCTHFNKAQPENRDSIYGRDSFAWYCGKTEPEDSRGTGWIEGETYYTLNGFDHPYICSGNIGCSRDILAPPTGPDGKLVKDFPPLPVWMFYWGGDEYKVVKGHLEVLMLWDRMKE